MRPVPSLATIVENLARAAKRTSTRRGGPSLRTSGKRGQQRALVGGRNIGHLSAVERAILSRADKLLHAERTLAFIEETRDRDLSKYSMPHPFLGTLNAYEWLQFIASHEIRHTKQMREIAGTLPKTSKQVCISRTFLPLCWPLLCLRTTHRNCRKVWEKAGFTGFREKVLEG